MKKLLKVVVGYFIVNLAVGKYTFYAGSKLNNEEVKEKIFDIRKDISKGSFLDGIKNRAFITAILGTISVPALVYGTFKNK